MQKKAPTRSREDHGKKPGAPGARMMPEAGESCVLLTPTHRPLLLHQKLSRPPRCFSNLSAGSSFVYIQQRLYGAPAPRSDSKKNAARDRGVTGSQGSAFAAPIGETRQVLEALSQCSISEGSLLPPSRPRVRGSAARGAARGFLLKEPKTGKQGANVRSALMPIRGGAS